MHIAFNMLTLASFGPLLERFLGEKKYILLYFLSGESLWLIFYLLAPEIRAIQPVGRSGQGVNCVNFAGTADLC